MSTILQAVKHYEVAEDVYKMYEAGLFWKVTTDRPKAHFVSIQCTNANSSHTPAS